MYVERDWGEDESELREEGILNTKKKYECDITVIVVSNNTRLLLRNYCIFLGVDPLATFYDILAQSQQEE